MNTLKNSKKYQYLHYYEEKFLNELIEKIESFYPTVQKIILYGSKARGDFLENSDIDLLFIVKTPLDKKVKFAIYDLISDLEIKYNVLASSVFVSEKEFKNRKTSFLKNVKKEGTKLWLREWIKGKP